MTAVWSGREQHPLLVERARNTVSEEIEFLSLIFFGGGALIVFLLFFSCADHCSTPAQSNFTVLNRWYKTFNKLLITTTRKCYIHSLLHPLSSPPPPPPDGEPDADVLAPADGADALQGGRVERGAQVLAHRAVGDAARRGGGGGGGGGGKRSWGAVAVAVAVVDAFDEAIVNDVDVVDDDAVVQGGRVFHVG